MSTRSAIIDTCPKKKPIVQIYTQVNQILEHAQVLGPIMAAPSQ